MERLATTSRKFAVIRTAQQLKYAGRGAEATGFAGPPHGVRSRKVL